MAVRRYETSSEGFSAISASSGTWNANTAGWHNISALSISNYDHPGGVIDFSFAHDGSGNSSRLQAGGASHGIQMRVNEGSTVINHIGQLLSFEVAPSVLNFAIDRSPGTYSFTVDLYIVTTSFVAYVYYTKLRVTSIW